MSFTDEREIVERALALGDLDNRVEPVFPPVSQRFLRAREAAELTPDEVAEQWGEPASMYWDLELYDSEAFDVISVQDLVTLAAVLHVSVMQLLFGEEPARALPVTSYLEVTRRLRAAMKEQEITVDQMSDAVGWDLGPFLAQPDKLAELPIFGLRWVCDAAGVDWATTLGNPRARRGRAGP
jgi:hypothetical protein